ncbi:MAG: M23 family metallopeptidase [Magnetococcales bacterium]|nr:M23 family metallopeptidase [Magnetococcales bacterium]
MIKRIFISIGIILSPPLWAESRTLFDLPVRCAMGEKCLIQNYVDHDPGPEQIDYHCGSLTYNGHQGTDFRVKTYLEMQEGVDVVAAADGKVKAIRNTVEDGPPSGQVATEKIKKQPAGNGVVLDHGQGWESQYSHLRQGSVTVIPGQQVRTGDPLGKIGQSGLAEFPHLHFEIRLHGRPMDPFQTATTPLCGEPRLSLWNTNAAQKLDYLSSGELSSGFAITKPDETYVAAPPQLSPSLWPNAPALIFWVNLFGVRQHDQETIRLLDPKGTILAEHTNTYNKHQARSMRYIGKSRLNQNPFWTAGTYIGDYILMREGNDKPVIHITRQITIP